MSGSYEMIHSQPFWDCIDSLRRDDSYKGALVDTLSELRRKPFRNPKLQTHDVGVATNRKKIFSSDVGGRRSDRRIVWQLFNRTIVLLLYGTHKVQQRAKRMRIDFDPDTQAYTVYERATDSIGVEQTYNRHREKVGKLFMAWTDDELESFGLPPPVVTHLRRIDSDEEFLGMEDKFGSRYFETAYNLVAHGHPDGVAPERAVSDVMDPSKRDAPPEATPPEVTEDDLEVERKLTHHRTGAWFTPFEPEFLKEVMGQPIEDWMIFLHPDQRGEVRRRYKGPARIRGAAGYR